MNKVWGSLILIAIAVSLGRYLTGDNDILSAVSQASFESVKLAVDIALGLIGVLALWSGLFSVAEQAGLIQYVSKALAPLLRRLMPEVPPEHPAHGAVTMNLAANALGLDNAATPLGLKAMESLQSLNPLKNTASNAQILFLVLNTSSVTLLPITIFMYRAQLGASDPTDVFLPILFATTASSLTGLLTIMFIQGIKFDHVIITYLTIFLAFMSSLVSFLQQLPAAELSQFSQSMAHLVLLLVISSFIGAGLWSKQPIYEQFIEGAKQGFTTAVTIIPYLVAMLFAVGLLRASGTIDICIAELKALSAPLLSDIRFMDALPVAITRPLSGGGARAMMIETLNTYGVDSFAGRLASVMQGSTETTFYVLSLYFGAVGITRIRYALWAGLLCDVIGLSSAVIVCYWFFG